MTKILSFILGWLARAYLWRYRPKIIAITGNVGKTTTKELVAQVLGRRFQVRASGGNLNNELGMPLALIGEFSQQYYSSRNTFQFWLKVLSRGLWGLIIQQNYPEILVLEYGADRPGDIKRLTQIIKPDISVVTQIGSLPVHVEFFASPEHLAQEKSRLVSCLKASDKAILYFDNLTILEMRRLTKAQVLTYGLGEGADVRATDLAVKLNQNRPQGLGFNLSVGHSLMPVAIKGTLGQGMAVAAAAATAVATTLGLGLAEISETLSNLKPIPGRLRILAGIKDSLIIDDSYNASVAAVHLAIDTIRDLPGRKILVLGEMRELGRFSIQAHQSIGTLAAQVANELICVGLQAKIMAEAASNQLPQEKVQWFATSSEAGLVVQKIIRPQDLVLVKGSQGVRMEKVVLEIMSEPSKAGQLLVRQSPIWQRK